MMNALGPIEIGLIAAIVVAAICFVLFLIALGSKKKAKRNLESQYETKAKNLSESYEETLEKERVESKKTITKQKEDYESTLNVKNREIDALKLFSKNQSEYVTDMRLIGIRERLVKEKRIRPEDMHIMANIFMPTNHFSDVQHISHLVLTRTGLYIIDSQLLKGHVYHGISGQQFDKFPMMQQVFETLDLDAKVSQTLVLDQNEDQKSLSFINYSEHLAEIEKLATDLQRKLDLKYTPMAMVYFNPKAEKGVTISNFTPSQNVKVLVGPEQLDEYFNKYVFHGRFQYKVEDLQDIMEKIEAFN